MEKHWWFKNWRMDDFPPNSPMLAPSKVSLHTVYMQPYRYVWPQNKQVVLESILCKYVGKTFADMVTQCF